MKKHNCPYLEGAKYCTHKATGLRNNKKKRRICGYSNPFMCVLLYRSKSLLTTALRHLKIDKTGDVR